MPEAGPIMSTAGLQVPVSEAQGSHSRRRVGRWGRPPPGLSSGRFGPRLPWMGGKAGGGGVDSPHRPATRRRDPL